MKLVDDAMMGRVIPSPRDMRLHDLVGPFGMINNRLLQGSMMLQVGGGWGRGRGMGRAAARARAPASLRPLPAAAGSCCRRRTSFPLATPPRPQTLADAEALLFLERNFEEMFNRWGPGDGDGGLRVVGGGGWRERARRALAGWLGVSCAFEGCKQPSPPLSTHTRTPWTPPKDARQRGGGLCAQGAVLPVHRRHRGGDEDEGVVARAGARHAAAGGGRGRRAARSAAAAARSLCGPPRMLHRRPKWAPARRQSQQAASIPLTPPHPHTHPSQEKLLAKAVPKPSRFTDILRDTEGVAASSTHPGDWRFRGYDYE